MSRFLTDITSIYWWISVVVVGILVNILGTLISRTLDVPLSKVSSRWRDKSQAQKLETEKEIAKLKSSQHEQVMITLQILNHKSSTLISGLLGAGLIVFGMGFFAYGAIGRSILSLVWGGFNTILGVSCLFTAIREILATMKKSRWLTSAFNESEASHETPEQVK